MGRKESEHAAQVAANMGAIEYHFDLQSVAKGFKRVLDSEKNKKKL